MALLAISSFGTFFFVTSFTHSFSYEIPDSHSFGSTGTKLFCTGIVVSGGWGW